MYLLALILENIRLTNKVKKCFRSSGVLLFDLPMQFKVILMCYPWKEYVYGSVI